MTSPRSTFFHYLARYRLQLVAGAVLAAGSSLAAVVPPRFIGAIIDSLGRAGTQFEDVLRLALLIVGFAALVLTLGAGTQKSCPDPRLDASTASGMQQAAATATAMANGMFSSATRLRLTGSTLFRCRYGIRWWCLRMKLTGSPLR